MGRIQLYKKTKRLTVIQNADISLSPASLHKNNTLLYDYV